MRELVATDTSVIENIRAVLSSKGFKVFAKEVNEQSIYGEKIPVEIIYGVSKDESIIFSTKRYKDMGRYRVRISIEKNLDDFIDIIESLGFKVYVDDKRVIIIGYFDEKEVINSLSSLLKILI